MAHPDYDKLVNKAVPFAQQMLQEHGEFHPFACVISANDEFTHIGVDTGKEQPGAHEVVEELVFSLKDMATNGMIHATAICIDVRTIPPGQTEKSDAICMRLERSDTDPIQVILPYRKKLMGRYDFGEMFATAGDREIFEP
jgi:hypothetical protein